MNELWSKIMPFLLVVLATACHSAVQTQPANPAVQQHRDESTVQPVTSERSNAELESAMQAILSTDPQVEARKSAAAGDVRYWAVYQGRQRVLPGISDQVKGVETRAAPGMGDVVYGSRHKALRQQMLDYMARYNQQLQVLGQKAPIAP